MVALVNETQGNNGSSGGTTISLTIPSTTAGNCLVVGIATVSATISSITLGGSAGNFAQLAVENPGGLSPVFFWGDPNCAGGQTSIVITLSASDHAAANVYEFSGLALSSLLDKTSGGSSSSAVTSWSSGSTATTTNTVEAWVGIVFAQHSATTITGPSSPWTNESVLDVNVGGTLFPVLSGYQIRSSTGVAVYSGTFSAGDEYTALVVALNPGVIPVSVSDSGTGTDSLAVSATAPLSDSGTGIDSLAVGPVFPTGALGSKIELLLNGAWADITSFVYSRADIAIGRGRPNEASSANPASMALTLNNRDGRFSPKNSGGAYYPFLTRNTQIRVSVRAASVLGQVFSGFRFWGEVSQWPPQWDPSGSDVYVNITAAGILRRLQQGPNIGSALQRYYTRLTGNFVPIAYWPCEDMSAATSFASAIPGVPAGTWTGTPSLASNTAFGGSDAIPALNGSVWTLLTGAANPPGVGSITQTTPGTYQWTAPPGVTAVTGVFVVAGGGGINGPGGDSTFTGDTVTVHAHGGGAGSGGGSTGQGGTGSTNTTHFNGGNGGASGAPGVGGGGYVGGGGGGGGGGGSGGTAAAGNPGGTGGVGGPGTSGGPGAGGTAGAGATAVTGGGPGGVGGAGGSNGQGGSGGLQPASGPGGGAGGSGGGGSAFLGSSSSGAGGGESAAEASVAVTPGNTYTYVVGAAGGGVANGQAGQVSFSWNSGATVPVAGNILRFLLDIPSGGGVDGAVIAQMKTLGTIATVKVFYHTGGNLELIGYNSSNAQLFDSGSQAFTANGKPMLVSVELTPSGTSVNWKLTAIQPGATSAIATFTGTQTLASLGAVTEVDVNAGGIDTGSTGTGHYTVQYYADTLVNVAAAVGGFTGERAGARFQRLCTELGISFEFVGNVSDTPQMGPQTDDKAVNLLQGIEDFDRGQLYEPRDLFGLAYRTRVSLENQSAAVVYNYAGAQVAQPFQPISDDQLTRNDVTAVRANGSSARQFLSSGTMSIQAPPNGVGEYPFSLTVAANADSQLANLAQWIVNIGTVDDFRYPSVVIDLSRSADASVFAATAGLDIGAYFQITNPPVYLETSTIKQLAFGFQETINTFKWTIAINAVPEIPYEGGSLPTW